MIQITRKVEFDAGHRIPDHNSKCRNMHGHRYVLEATLQGELIEGGSSAGMVQDFGDLKGIMNAAVADRWDHAFLCYTRDNQAKDALECIEAHKTVFLSVIPTVENLVTLAALLIHEELAVRSFPGHLVHVRLYETPNCWADWYP